MNVNTLQPDASERRRKRDRKVLETQPVDLDELRVRTPEGF